MRGMLRMLEMRILEAQQCSPATSSKRSLTPQTFLTVGARM